jgi:murein DD-endopeptidase MepM/ murein hydrolase activator NlpD
MLRRWGSWEAPSRVSVRLRGVLILSATVLALLGAVTFGGGPGITAASAQTPDTCVPPEDTIPGTPTSVPVCATTTTTSTTTTTAPPASTTTTRPTTTTTSQDQSSTTTTEPGQPSQGSGGGGGGGGAPGGSQGGGSGQPSAGSPALVPLPPGLFTPVIGSAAAQPPSGLSSLPVLLNSPPGALALGPGTRSTGPIVDLLDPLHLPQRAINRLFAPFPCAGRCTYHEDNGPGPGPSLGVDLDADAGTAVVASLDGIVHLDASSGVSTPRVEVTAPDGTVHAFSHLDGSAPDLVDGQHVSVGDLLGSVGGPSAPGDLPHMHFDVRPLGGPATDPVPQLDHWLAQALSNAQTLVGNGKGAAKAVSSSGFHGAATFKRIAVGGQSLATLLPGVAVVGFGLWFGVTRVLRRRRDRGFASDLAIEFTAPVELADKFLLRLPAPRGWEPWWRSWQSHAHARWQRLRERRSHE